MMLKCGQKDNKNYTFGVTEKQIKEAQEVKAILSCLSCGKTFDKKVSFCSSCGGKI
jgi:rRNA maturation endonuclease Nob1